MKTDIKNYIANALFELLKSKELNNIKITELIKLAGISRTTFYNHFKNINDVIDYKIEFLTNDILKIIKLNNLRHKKNKDLLINILNYINKNKIIFIIIKNKLFFKLKDNLDKYFVKNYNYYIISGIIINLCILYINNDFTIELDKIKID